MTEAQKIDFFIWSGELDGGYQLTKDIVYALSEPSFIEKRKESRLKEFEEIAKRNLPGPGSRLHQDKLPKDREDKFMREFISLVTPTIARSLDDYKNYVINLGLAHLCSIFEAFLADLVQTLRNNKVQRRTKAEFPDKGILNKMKYFQIYGISVEGVFDLRECTQELKDKFSEKSQETLSEIFLKRNKFLHERQLVLTELKDLEFISKFLRAMCESLGRIAAVELKIPVTICGVGIFNL